MRNYVQPGNTVTVTAPYSVLSGAGVLVGSLFGVASTSATGNTRIGVALAVAANPSGIGRVRLNGSF